MKKILALFLVLALNSTSVFAASDDSCSSNDTATNAVYYEVYEPRNSYYIDMYSYGLTSPKKGALHLEGTLTSTLPSYKCQITAYILDSNGDTVDDETNSKLSAVTLDYDTSGESGKYYSAKFVFSVLDKNGKVLDTRVVTTNSVKCL